MTESERMKDWPTVHEFWTGKRVIVTGGAGFLGSEVVRRLKGRGCATVSVPRSKKYDLRERSLVESLFDDVGPTDIVIHLAARVGGIGYNQVHPAELFYDNAAMGLHLMEVARRRGVEKFVAIGTICAYPKFTPIPFREADLWMGYPEETNAPYGLAKKMLLVQAQAYRKQYGFNAIYLLPVNLYGPGDNFSRESSHVIPALVRKCEDAIAEGADSIVAWGDGSPTREFLYVDDAAEGIILATERYNEADAVNLGSSHEISIKDLLQTIVRLTGFEGEVRWDSQKPNGQPRRKLDTSLAETAFGFYAKVPFEDGLRTTIQWYRNSR